MIACGTTAVNIWWACRLTDTTCIIVLHRENSLPEDRRTERLAYAEEVEKDFLANAMQLPAGPERIAFLRSVDPETQRLMVMRKLWHGMLAAHGGKPPKMQT